MNYYLNSMFRMYSGEKKRIELVCDNGIMDPIIDKFGEDVTIFSNDMKFFRAIINTAVGNVLYGWGFGFCGKVSIKSPGDVKEQNAQMVRSAAEELEKRDS
jgi:hypothetical protein